MYADFSPTRFQPWNPRRFDFYASKVAEVSNTQISTDAESTQIRFSLFNLFQARRRDRESVLHAAREARRRRRIPCRQSEVARRGTDLRLGESHLREWRSHTGAKTRGLAWPVFAQIVGAPARAARGGAITPSCSRSSDWWDWRDSSRLRARASRSRRAECRSGRPQRAPPAIARPGTTRYDRWPPASDPCRAPGAIRQRGVPNPLRPNTQAGLRDSCGSGRATTPWPRIVPLPLS